MNSPIIQLMPWRDWIIALHRDGSLSLVDIDTKYGQAPSRVTFTPLYLAAAA